MVGIPSTKKRPFYVKEWWPAVAAGVVGLGASAGSLWKEVTSEKPSSLQVILIAVVLLVVIVLGALKLAAAAYKDKEDDKKSKPDELKGPLYAIHRMIEARHGNGAQPGWLRVTIYRVDGAELEQSVGYVGGDDAGAGRRVPLSSGVVGRVARTKKPRHFHRDEAMSFEDWVKYLVDEMGMHESFAEQTRKDRFSFLAVPISGPNEEVRAVVYLDAKPTNFFMDNDVVDTVVFGCQGLAEWINVHYYSKAKG